ncbi:energy transducer TonB [Shewanella avicenniae]|uniref:Energy transducer TonB n=1 Tax=Shewanella avicenniae TaxID=2814294 RepID=A0ABX7QU97_9GAMM|nr:energy transducer TonB [Shewanella avicenniae]QSX34221.1 energy transducer TonB [Shewanella avicenniae]
MKLPLLVGGLLLLAGCQTSDNATATKPDPNQIKYVDLTREDTKDLLEKYWVISKRVEPRYNIEAAKKGLSGCVTTTVGIGSDGSLVGYKVTDSFPQGLFDQQAIASLQQWHWQATEANVDKVPVLTQVTLVFLLADRAHNMAEVEQHCNITPPAKS